MSDKPVILSIAGVLPQEKIEIDTGSANNNELSGYENESLKNKRFIWRIKNQQDILSLSKKSVIDCLSISNIPSHEIDYLIFTIAWTDDPTFPEPALLSKEAGLSCPSIGLAAGTNGGAAAIEIASALIISGQYKRIAIVSACNYGHFFRADDPVRQILSDGSACMIMGKGHGLQLIASHTLSTADYPILDYIHPTKNHGKGYVVTPPGSGEYVIAHIGRTVAECCEGVCHKAGCSIENIELFYVYDPVHWMREVTARALDIDISKIYPSFLNYGSLGPALNPIVMAEIAQNKPSLRPGAKILCMGFGPMATATASIFHWEKFPAQISQDH